MKRGRPAYRVSPFGNRIVRHRTPKRPYVRQERHRTPKRPYVRQEGSWAPGWDIDAETGCWNWTGTTYSTTGRPHWRGGLAYRRVYEQRVGPIPDGHHLHHACKNMMCVNPDHLEPLTPQEHARRHAA